MLNIVADNNFKPFNARHVILLKTAMTGEDEETKYVETSCNRLHRDSIYRV